MVKITLLEDTREVFKVLENKLSEANIKHVEDLCNQALQTVFDTEEVKYSINIETLVQRNNNQVQFYLTEKNIATNEEVKTRIEDNGFGVQSLIGLVLQIYFIIIHRQQHILFLDESLTAISVDKLPKLKIFLNEVSKKLDFKFVLLRSVKQSQNTTKTSKQPLFPSFGERICFPLSSVVFYSTMKV